jgi:tetratricopeptide (TPR) repeat protein
MSTEIAASSAPSTEPGTPALTLRKQLVWMAPASLLILLAASFWLWSESRSTRVRTEVFQAFTEAADAEAFEQVARAWPGEPEAPLALLRAGELRFNKGEFSAALALYEEFGKIYPKHRMADAAAWGRVLSLEASGKHEEALAIFLTHDDSSLFYPQALFGRARTLEKLGRPQEALVIYDLIETEFPGSGWFNQAREFRKPLEIALRTRAE